MKIIKKEVKTPCYCCNLSTRGKTTLRNKCKACNGTGQYTETHYQHIIMTKSGKQYCIDGDTIK
jgi:DnaJ-class molecular chaperone